MEREVGSRVGAIRDADGEGSVINVYGYGVYEGDHIPPDDVGGYNFGFPNPRIKLDNGTIIWGCECWWGPEDKIQKKVAEYKTVVFVEHERISPDENVGG